MKHKKGFILISILMLTGISSLLLISSSNELIQHTRIIINQQNYIRCFYAADAALMRFRHLLKTTANFDLQTTSIDLKDSRLDIIRQENNLSAKAICKNSQLQINLIVNDINNNRIQPRWTIP